MARSPEYPRAIARKRALESAIRASSLNRYELTNAVGFSITYVTHVRKGLAVPIRVADAFASALGAKTETLFEIITKAPRAKRAA
jgi:hypothetical protein